MNLKRCVFKLSQTCSQNMSLPVFDLSLYNEQKFHHRYHRDTTSWSWLHQPYAYEKKLAFFFVYSWDLNRGEINEIANELYEENDENYTADEYMITYVNECNTHDEPVSKPDEWMAKEIHDSENACARK